MFHFAYKTHFPYKIFRLVLKRLKLYQFFDGVARNFSYTQAQVFQGVLGPDSAYN